MSKPKPATPAQIKTLCDLYGLTSVRYFAPNTYPPGHDVLRNGVTQAFIAAGNSIDDWIRLLKMNGLI